MTFYKINLTNWNWKPWLVLNSQNGDVCHNWLRIGKWQLHLNFARCGHRYQRYSYETKTILLKQVEHTYVSRERQHCGKCDSWRVLTHEGAKQ